MKNAVFAMLFGFVRSFLQNASQAVWDGMWEVIFEGIEEAEEKWNDEGKGEEKKQFVKDKVMKFIEDKADLNFFQKKAVLIFLDKVINGIVKGLNDELGKGWVKKVEEYKDELAGYISFIE